MLKSLFVKIDEFLEVKHEDWQPCKMTFDVTTIHGETLNGPLMRAYIDGAWRYRKRTEEEDWEAFHSEIM
jgi:hypothetical protein